MRYAASVFVLVSPLLLAPSVSGAVISFDVVNVAGDTWQYDYVVDNDSSTDTLEEFTIFFPLHQYADLTVAAVPVDWDGLVIQPDPALPADGFFDALALISGLAPGTEQGGFSVQFRWLGSSPSPGRQLFHIVDPVTFDVLDSGLTSQPGSVPEPALLLLLGIATSLRLAARNVNGSRHATKTDKTRSTSL